jgi:hypothetical protein
MSENMEAVELMTRRYGEMRTEILARIDARYKLLQLTIAVTAALFSVIWAASQPQLGFVGAFLLLCATLLYYGDNRAIAATADYLLKIEESLDATLDVPVQGWERWSRQSHIRKGGSTAVQMAAYLLFFAVSYTTFIYIGCDAIASEFRPWVGIAAELPLIGVASYAFLQYRSFWISLSRISRVRSGV